MSQRKNFPIEPDRMKDIHLIVEQKKNASMRRRMLPSEILLGPSFLEKKILEKMICQNLVVSNQPT